MSHREKDDCSFSEELVTHLSAASLEFLKFVTDQMVYEKFTLKIRQHDPETKAKFDGTCREQKYDLLNDPEELEEEYCCDPTYVS